MLLRRDFEKMDVESLVKDNQELRSTLYELRMRFGLLLSESKDIIESCANSTESKELERMCDEWMKIWGWQ